MIAAIALDTLAGPAAYLTLAGLVAAESMGVPVPGETALLAAAVLAHQGHLALPVVVTVAAVAAIVGDNVGFLLGRRGGRWLLQRPGPLRSHREHLLERGERFFARHGSKAVFLARFVTGVRVTAAWMAGVNRMPWETFLAWNTLGAITWATAVGGLGYVLGATAERLVRYAGVVGLAVVAAAAAIAGAWWLLKRRRQAASAVAARDSEP
ncbi:MAG: DedA family protein [Solirubrobacteraceae bacterium]